MIRRSRLHRTSLGKALALTPRDLEIFRVLSRYRYLRSTYLHAFAGGASETRFKERLGDLFHEGYIDRPAKQWEFASARHLPAIYEIGARAKRVLVESAICTDEGATYLGSGAARQFAHAVLICESLASFEIGSQRSADLRFIPGCEICARKADRSEQSKSHRSEQFARTLVPDGLFGLEYRAAGKSLYRFFALEIDRGTMPIARSDSNQTSIYEKLKGYQQIATLGLQQERWGIPNLLVLMVTSTEDRKADMMRKCASLGHAPQILFKAWEGRPQAPDGTLLTLPWERMALSPLSIVTAA
ncbi:MAG TPA: replication-relaxation family protein [Rhizomicrobium sp.]|jgi:hypothetical protein